MAARGAFYHQAILDGYMSRDEVRSRENMNAMPAGGGKTYFIPQNVAILHEDGSIEPVNQPAGGANSAPGLVSNSVREAHADALGDVIRRMVRRAEKTSEPQELVNVIVEALSHPMKAARMALGLNGDTTPADIAELIVTGNHDATALARRAVGFSEE